MWTLLLEATQLYVERFQQNWPKLQEDTKAIVYAEALGMYDTYAASKAKSIH